MRVIQCATPFEFDALRVAAGNPSVEKIGKRGFFVIENDTIVLKGSVGKVWAAASAEFSINHWKPMLIVDFGAAGALDSKLKVGDLVFADSVVEHDVRAARPINLLIAVDPGRVFQLSGTACVVGRIAAGDQDVQSIEERDAIARAHGAIAVTWESSAIARVCQFHGVQYASVRVITDIGKDEFLAEYKKNAARVLEPAARKLLELLGLKV